MFKRITIPFLVWLFCFQAAFAQFLGVKSSSETISFFVLEPIAADGSQDTPDSVHIFTYADNASAATYTTRSTSYPFAAVGIDTLKIYDDTTYVYKQTISTIDGGGGNFELAIVVRMFAGGVPTDTRAIVQIISDSLNYQDVNMGKVSGDATAADNFETMLDGTGGHTLSLSGLHIRASGNDTALIAMGSGSGMGGFFYGGATNGHGIYAAGQGSGATGIGAVGGDGGNSNGFAAVGYGTGHGIYATNSDGSGNGAYFEGGPTNGHGLVAWGKGIGDGIVASGGANGDGLRAGGQGPGKDFNATIDLDDLAGDFETSNFNGVSAFWNEGKTGYSADMVSISGDATAADNFETMLDGAGGQTLSLGKLDISGANGASGSFSILNSSGPGVHWYTSGNYAGAHIYSLGTGANADGILIEAGVGGRDIDAFIDTVQYVDTVDRAPATTVAGSGPYLCSLMVVNSTPAAITDGTVSLSSGGTSYSADISGDGFAVFNLTGATWTGLAYATGYAQDTIPQTFVISASVKDTITMTAQSIANPSNPSLVRVYAWTDNILGDTLQGAIMTAIPRVRGGRNWIAANDRVVLPRQEWSTADDSGYVYLDLYPTETTNNDDGDSLYYDIQVSKQGYPTIKFDKFRVYDDSTGNTQMVKRQ